MDHKKSDGAGGEKNHARQNIRKNINARKNPKKKFIYKMSRIFILNEKYNSSRKLFQNAPNGIRACLDFQNFSGEGPPYENGPPAQFNTAGVICRTPNAERRTTDAKQNHRDKQKKKKKNGVLFRLTGVYLALRLKKAQVSLFKVSSQ